MITQRYAQDYYRHEWNALRDNVDDTAKKIGDELVERRTPTWGQMKVFQDIFQLARERSSQTG